MLYEISLHVEDDEHGAHSSERVVSAPYYSPTGELPKGLREFANMLADDKARYGDVAVEVGAYEPTKIMFDGNVSGSGVRTLLDQWIVDSLEKRRRRQQSEQRESEAVIAFIDSVRDSILSLDGVDAYDDEYGGAIFTAICILSRFYVTSHEGGTSLVQALMENLEMDLPAELYRQL